MERHRSKMFDMHEKRDCYTCKRDREILRLLQVYELCFEHCKDQESEYANQVLDKSIESSSLGWERIIIERKNEK